MSFIKWFFRSFGVLHLWMVRNVRKRLILTMISRNTFVRNTLTWHCLRVVLKDAQLSLEPYYKFSAIWQSASVEAKRLIGRRHTFIFISFLSLRNDFLFSKIVFLETSCFFCMPSINILFNVKVQILWNHFFSLSSSLLNI